MFDKHILTRFSKALKEFGVIIATSVSSSIRNLHNNNNGTDLAQKQADIYQHPFRGEKQGKQPNRNNGEFKTSVLIPYPGDYGALSCHSYSPSIHSSKIKVQVPADGEPKKVKG